MICYAGVNPRLFVFLYEILAFCQNATYNISSILTKGGELDLRDPDKIIQELKEVVPILWDAFDVGCQMVQAYFKGIEIDPYLAPDLLRYHIKKYIVQNNWRCNELRIEDIANNGLSFYYGSYHIRIWKDTGDDLPDPGLSSAKDAFLRQLHQPGLWEFDDQPENLAILWTVDKEYNLLQLRLAYPEPSMIEESPISMDWDVLFKRPLLQSDIIDNTVEENSQYDLPLEEEGTKEETSSGEDY